MTSNNQLPPLDIKERRYNGIEGLEGFGVAVNQFLGMTQAHSKEKFALPLTQHEHPVARYVGGSALLDTAFLADNYPPTRREQLLNRGLDVLDEALADFVESDTFPSFIAQARVDIADASIRRLFQLERQKPSAQELFEVHDIAEQEMVRLVGAISLMDDETSRDYMSGVGVSAELGVRSLLGRAAFPGQQDRFTTPAFFTLGSLLSEDLLTRMRQNNGKRANWDLTVFDTATLKHNTRIQVKHGGFKTPYVDNVTKVSFIEIGKGKRAKLGKLSIWYYANLLSNARSSESTEDSKILEQYASCLMQRVAPQ